MWFIAFVKRISVYQVALSAFMLMMYAAVFYFAWYTEVSAVLIRDQWHYLTMLTEYYETGFDFGLLSLMHGEHFQLGYNVWFLLNGIWFGLNTQLELYVGFLFLGGFLLVLYKEFDRSLKNNNSPLQRQMMFVPLLTVGLSFHQIISFTYSLLSFIAFSAMLLMMLFASALSKHLVDRDAARMRNLITVLAYFLLLVGLAGGGWQIYLGAAIVTICSWGVTHRPSKEKIFKLGAGLLVLTVLIWILSFGDAGASNTNSGMAYVFQHLGQAAVFILVLLANSILDVNWFFQAKLMGWVYVTGVVVAALYLFAIYLFYKTRMWEKSYVPLYLISYFWIFSLALLLYRFPEFGVNTGAFPRYVTNLQLGLLGALWVIIYWIRALPKQKATAMWFVVGLATGVPYALHLWAAAENAGYIRNAAANDIKTVLLEKFDARSSACPNAKLCRQGVITLKAHQLNIYKDKDKFIPFKITTIKFKGWEPQSTRKGIVPHVGSNGNAGLWFKLEVDPGLGQVQIYFDGQPVATYFHDLVITASIPPELFNTSGKKKIVVRQVSTGKDFEVGEFVVLDKEEPIQLKDISIKFKRWSPQSTKRGIVPHVQPDGYAGLWFQLEADPGLGKIQIYFDGQPVATHFHDLIITASVPAELFNTSGKKKIVVRQVLTGKDFEVGEFVVLAD